MNIISMQNITKKYGDKQNTTYALNDVSLEIEKGEMIAIMGPSGSGKTTLLNILGCLDSETSGKYYLDGVLTKSINKNKLAKIRNTKIGFVFQQFALLQGYTALENLELPLLYGNFFRSLKYKMSESDRKKLALKYLDSVGLLKYADKKPSELSGGQQQRVAIARALICNPSIILADEPTGALDQKTGIDIINILTEINKVGKTVIIVTHDQRIASYCHRTIMVQDGFVSCY